MTTLIIIIIILSLIMFAGYRKQKREQKLAENLTDNSTQQNGIDLARFGADNVKNMRSILDVPVGESIHHTADFQITLPAWRLFQSRQGIYTSKDSADESDGTVRVNIGGMGGELYYTYNIAQQNAINYLLNNQDKIRDAILQAFLNDYPHQKEIYEEHIPDITSIDQYKNLIGISTIHILETEKDGFAYLGFEFGCDWDEEHGIGAMTYKERVIEVGAGEVGFNGWSAEEDSESAEKDLN